MEEAIKQQADPVGTYTDSWKRIEQAGAGRLAFFAAFYDRFLGGSAEIREKFAHADLARQQLMLKQSFAFMEFYFTRGEANAQLRHIAERHSRADLDIPPRFYACWLDALLATVQDTDSGCDDQVLDAWRTIFTPGIEFMKSMY